MRGSWKPNRTATYWPPHSYGHNSVYFPFSWAAQPGAWRPSHSGRCSSFQHLLSNWSELQLLNRGSSGPPLLGAGFLYRILSPTGLISNWLKFLCTELYNSSPSTFFLWASRIALIQPVHSQGYILIFLDWMHLLFTQMHFLFWQLGQGQYATVWHERQRGPFINLEVNNAIALKQEPCLCYFSFIWPSTIADQSIC